MNNCSICKKAGNIHYRFKLKPKTYWGFACPNCWHSISNLDNYVYGGTRKYNKKR